jgi:hypothetical protein
MDTNDLIRQLSEERDRIDAVIKLLSGSDAPTMASVKGKRKKMSAATRKQISEAQKKRWAKQRKAK